MTQIYNRRKISDILNEEYIRAKRYGTTLSAIMVDLDWFKNINDALQLAERMRVQISELHFELGISLTCCFGITEYKLGDDLEKIIKRTDNALYKAKERHNATSILWFKLVYYL